MGLRIPEGLLDLHSLRVELLDSSSAVPFVWERCGQQPRRSVQSPIEPRPRSLAAIETRSPTAQLVRADEVHAEAITVSRRQPNLADVANASRRFLVERIGVAPATASFAVILDLVADPPNPIPPVRLDRFEPRSTKTRVGDHDWTAPCGHDGLQGEQELSVCSRAVVALHRVHAFVDRARHASVGGQEADRPL